jgi:hypothetical protein
MNKPIGWREVSSPPLMSVDSEYNTEEIVDYLVRAGGQAPSWYNCQPWQFQANSKCIEILLDNSRDQSFYNWGNFNALLACGAAVKNILIAAQGRGVGADVVFLPDINETLLVARINLHFGRKVHPTEADLALEKAIWIRHTNTLLFDNKSLSELELQAFQQVVKPDSDLALHWLTNDGEKEIIFAAASCVEQIRFSRRDLHEQLHRMIRWNEKQAYAEKTGYTLPSMGACGFGKSFFWLTRSWQVMRLMNTFGANKNQAQRACEGLRHCGAIGLLTVRGHTDRDLLAAGLGMQAVWLKVTVLGFQVQPHNSMLQFFWAWRRGKPGLFSAQEQKLLVASWGMLSKAFPFMEDLDRFQPVFLFRVGKGAAMAGHTLRLSV